MRTSDLARRAMVPAFLLCSVACAPMFGDRPRYEVKPVTTASDPVLSQDHGEYQIAVNAIENRDYGSALDHLQAAREIEPNDVRVLNAFGVVYDKLGRFDLSARYYAQAQAVDPKSQIVARNLEYSKVLQGVMNGAPVSSQLASLPPVPDAREIASEELRAIGPQINGAEVVATQHATSQPSQLVAPAGAQAAGNIPVVANAQAREDLPNIAPINVDVMKDAAALVAAEPTQGTELAANKITVTSREVTTRQVAQIETEVANVRAPDPAADKMVPQQHISSAATEAAPAPSHPAAVAKIDQAAAPLPVSAQEGKPMASIVPAQRSVDALARGSSQVQQMAASLPSHSDSKNVNPTVLVVASNDAAKPEQPALTQVSRSDNPLGLRNDPVAIENIVRTQQVATSASVDQKAEKASAPAPVRTADLDAVPTSQSTASPFNGADSNDVASQTDTQQADTGRHHWWEGHIASAIRWVGALFDDQKAAQPQMIARSATNAPTRLAKLTKPSKIQLGAQRHAVPKHLILAAAKPKTSASILLTGHPLMIVGSLGPNRAAETIRKNLQKRGWFVTPVSASAAPQPDRTTIRYTGIQLAVAQALAKTLTMQVHLVPDRCGCQVRLVVGRDISDTKWAGLANNKIRPEKLALASYQHLASRGAR